MDEDRPKQIFKEALTEMLEEKPYASWMTKKFHSATIKGKSISG